VLCREGKQRIAYQTRKCWEQQPERRRLDTAEKKTEDSNCRRNSDTKMMMANATATVNTKASVFVKPGAETYENRKDPAANRRQRAGDELIQKAASGES
jgi:hypothetical protein